MCISVAAGDNIKEDGSCLERLPPHVLPDKLMKLDEKILSEKEKYPIAVAPSMLDIKSKMENFNDDGKSAFSMIWEIKSIKKKSYNSNDFVVGKKLKKVENFE